MNLHIVQQSRKQSIEECGVERKLFVWGRPFYNNFGKYPEYAMGPAVVTH